MRVKTIIRRPVQLFSTARSFRRGKCVTCGGANGTHEGLWFSCQKCFTSHSTKWYGKRGMKTIQKKEKVKTYCLICGCLVKRSNMKYCPADRDEGYRQNRLSYNQVQRVAWGGYKAV
jgi:hypothetical protein